MNKALSTILALTAMLAAGCSDGAIAPSGTAAGDAANLSKADAPGQLKQQTDTATYHFTIDPSRESIGDAGAGTRIVFPQGSLCDPNTSSYGPSEWDKPCAVATSALTVTARTWVDKKGHPRVDFEPAIRFVPTADPSGWVRITFKDLAAAAALKGNILYCKHGNSGCVDESNADATMVTMKDPVTGLLTRRIKHFSGYSITTGEECYTDDWDCIQYR